MKGLKILKAAYREELGRLVVGLLHVDGDVSARALGRDTPVTRVRL